jgi:hypothetical protein
MYATTRYNFVHLKVRHKISPLEELVGGDLPPKSHRALKLKSHFAAGALGDSIRFVIFVVYQFHPGT